MRVSKLFFMIFFSATFLSFSQDVDYYEEAAIYLDRNHSLDQYGYAYDQLLTMLENQYPKSDENSEAWKYLETHKGKTLEEMKALLVPIYIRNFSKVEIQQMTLFYESDTGQQLVADRSNMTEEQKSALNSYYNSPLGRKIIERQPTLTKEIAAVSEGWSRDLYETAVSLLKN